MDWSPTEIQEAIAELAGKVLTEASDPWAALAEAGFLELTEPLEIAALMIEVGRSGARVPALATLALGAPVAEYADADDGEVLTGGLIEADSRDPRRAATRVEADGGGWRLHGEKICVPAVDRASRIAVAVADGVYVARLADCRVELQTGTDDDPLGIVAFDGAPAERLGGAEVFDWWLPRVDVAVSAVLLGLSRKALSLTAAYARERQQFNRPIGSFQAVQQRIADAWITAEVMEVCLWQAAWRVGEGLPSDRERAIARYWASEGSHQVCAAAQHLHGGFGFDRDYELHRYFLSAKQHEFILGGANAQLARIGDLLAART